MSNIKLDVSLYSLSSDFIRVANIEECLKTVADLGFKGIEIVAAQTVPEYPHPSDSGCIASGSTRQI